MKAIEIGAGDSYSSELLKISHLFDEVELVEPNESFCYDLLKHQKPNITILNRAVSNYAGWGRLIYAGYCSYLSEASSFLKLSCEENSEKFFHTQLITVFDSKSIKNCDYLVLTCHGSEFNILTNLEIRPKIITTKFYCHNQSHWNYYNQIINWMNKNGYVGQLRETNQYKTYFDLIFTKNG
jgi:hypothetical protein